ncbi:hypothetical protein N7456_005881 [Penicillium angulare]|uniref:C3H1-type domain-containing protein n=1 Tax=Penicillium angulare TaxID=116970 RepID=A0A9W9FZD1_9EURO|nr:hypothetical protein N7456_005881 [Penicillium angulare]
MSASEGLPAHFAARRDASGRTYLSPLVCVDDFDVSTNIVGVPREVTHEQTQGMVSCGYVEARPKPWEVERTDLPVVDLVPHMDHRHVEAVQNIKTLLHRMESDNEVPIRYRQALQKEITNGLQLIDFLNLQVLNTLAANASANGNAVGGLVDHNNQLDKDGKLKEKIYCSYWLRHGECDYSQQGCRFKHIMPLDLPTIQSLGLTDIPKWYREQNNIDSLLPPRPPRTNGGPSRPGALAIADRAFTEVRSTSNQLVVSANGANRPDQNGRQRNNYRGTGILNTGRGRRNGNTNGRARDNQQQGRETSVVVSNGSGSTASNSFGRFQRARQPTATISSNPAGRRSLPNPAALPFPAPAPKPAAAANESPKVQTPSPTPVPAKESSKVQNSSPTPPAAKESSTVENPSPAPRKTFAHKNKFEALEGSPGRLYSYADGYSSLNGTGSSGESFRLDTLVDADSNAEPVKTLSTFASLYQHLMSDSHPISPQEVLLNYGAIGDDVILQGAYYTDLSFLTTEEFEKISTGAQSDRTAFRDAGIPDTAEQ